jgi:hypothetical protein
MLRGSAENPCERLMGRFFETLDARLEVCHGIFE